MPQLPKFEKPAMPKLEMPKLPTIEKKDIQIPSFGKGGRKMML